MNGNTHCWLVEDAVRFVEAQGTQRERQAFQAWESAYGGGDLAKTPAANTRIVDVIGQESRYTDYYHDLAIYLESFAGLWQDNISEYDGNIFTALNHFLAVPWLPTTWRRTNGYHYFWSPRVGNDSRAMTGKVDDKDAEVDNEHSAIVDRCRFGWIQTASAWDNNWEADIRYTVFIPVSLLAEYYYNRLINRYFSYVDVNGERYDQIAGMHLLGPVCHAVADACVPQHTITTMALRHQEWESAAEQWAWSYALEDFKLVRTLLDTHMRRYTYVGGWLSGRLAIDYLVSELCGWRTFTQFLHQNNLNGIDAMKNPSWWDGYMTNVSKLKTDMSFNYNLAIAATVRVITEACYDVIATGGGHGSDPVLNGIPTYSPVGGVPKRDPQFPLSTDLPYFRIEGMLGYKPDTWRLTAASLFATRDVLTNWQNGASATHMVEESLRQFETNLYTEFRRARREGRENFDTATTLRFPAATAELRRLCGLPPVSANLDIQPTFGLATFRLPTQAELDSSAQFSSYLKASDQHQVNAKLLSITRCIALTRVLLETTQSRRGLAGLRRLVALRDQIIRTRKLPAENWRPSDMPMRPIELEAARPVEDVELGAID